MFLSHTLIDAECLDTKENFDLQSGKMQHSVTRLLGFTLTT